MIGIKNTSHNNLAQTNPLNGKIHFTESQQNIISLTQKQYGIICIHSQKFHRRFQHMPISLNIEQKNILALLSDKNSRFLIPDYQRPYAWEVNECATLWNDIHSFALPGNDCNKFKLLSYLLKSNQFANE